MSKIQWLQGKMLEYICQKNLYDWKEEYLKLYNKNQW